MRHTILDGHVLRSQDRPGLEQEVWALLTVYQLLRMAMVTAVESRPHTNPDRASFTTALQTARDQLIAADGIVLTNSPDASQPDLLGVIGRAVLATLLPPRRPRWSTRRVKNATSRYLNRDDRRPHLPTTIASIEVILHTPSIDETWRPRLPQARDPHAAPTRRELITALMERRPEPTLARPRTRRQARHQPPQHAHPTRRMDPPRLPHPHPRRHLPTPDTPRHRKSLTTAPPPNYAALLRVA